MFGGAEVEADLDNIHCFVIMLCPILCFVGLFVQRRKTIAITIKYNFHQEICNMDKCCLDKCGSDSCHT